VVHNAIQLVEDCETGHGTASRCCIQ